MGARPFGQPDTLSTDTKSFTVKRKELESTKGSLAI